MTVSQGQSEGDMLPFSPGFAGHLGSPPVMSYTFPERPILFYPSLAQRFGTDEAIALAVYQEFAVHHGASTAEGGRYFILRRSEWPALADFWAFERLERATRSLEAQGVLRCETNSNGSLTISLNERVTAASADATGAVDRAESAAEPGAPAAESVSREVHAAAPRRAVDPAPAESRPDESDGVPPRLSVRRPSLRRPSSEAAQLAASLAPKARDVPSNPLAARGPAPTFGGSTGWSRQPDALEELFAQREARNRQLHEMYPDWQPGEITYQMLQQHQIPREFASQRIDEFIAYWLERDRREVSWDHLFLKLVKREWVREQERAARAARSQQEGLTGSAHENPKATSRENRKRLSAAILNLKDTDW